MRVIIRACVYYADLAKDCRAHLAAEYESGLAVAGAAAAVVRAERSGQLLTAHHSVLLLLCEAVHVVRGRATIATEQFATVPTLQAKILIFILELLLIVLARSGRAAGGGGFSAVHRGLSGLQSVLVDLEHAHFAHSFYVFCQAECGDSEGVGWGEIKKIILHTEPSIK